MILFYTLIFFYLTIYCEHLFMSVHTDLSHCFYWQQVSLYMIEPLFISPIPQ